VGSPSLLATAARQPPTPLPAASVPYNESEIQAWEAGMLPGKRAVFFDKLPGLSRFTGNCQRIMDFPPNCQCRANNPALVL
jgi:hypothetical protein